MALIIKWNKGAVRHLEEVIKYIENDSPANASRVSIDLLSRIDALSNNPEMHMPDKYKINNDGSFRAFELHHYRISYRYKKNEIRIIRIRHTKMNPLDY